MITQPSVKTARSVFKRDHSWKGTFNAGWIVPVLVDEVIPGDTYNVSCSGFARLATPEFPFMDNLWIDIHFFFVPYRLVQDNFQKLMGEQVDPGDSISYLAPVVAAPAVTGFGAESLYDYLGIPTEVPLIEVVNYAGRGYNLIYNEWYRNQNLVDSAVVDRDDGPDTYTDYVIRNRNKYADYFTACLPWPAKTESVEIPLEGRAPVELAGGNMSASRQLIYDPGNPAAPSGAFSPVAAVLDGAAVVFGQAGPNAKLLNPNGTLIANLSAVTSGADINELRAAVQLQRFYERDARGGTRYTEILYSHFGVVSPDARLQRPEFLGSGRLQVNVHPIAQTSETGTTPQGNLAAFGTASGGSGFTKSFVEHGLILGLASCRGEQSYQQGLHRMWTRRARMEFAWPEFAHLGEQAVLNQEIYCDGSGDDLLPFGYMPRFEEYRTKQSTVVGQFRSNYATSLDAWHLTPDFAALPQLNGSFVTEPPPVERVLAVPTETHFIMDLYYRMKCVRALPMNGTPGMMDHF